MLLFLSAILLCVGVEGHGFLSFPVARTKTNAAVHGSVCGDTAKSIAMVYWIGNSENNVSDTIQANHGGGSITWSVITDNDESETNFDANIILSSTLDPTVSGAVSSKITFTKECAHCVLRWVWSAPNEPGNPYVGCSDIAVLTQEQPGSAEVYFQSADKNAVATTTGFSDLIQNALTSAGISSFITYTTPAVAKCTQGYEICWSSTLYFSKHYDYTNSAIVTAAQASNAFSTSQTFQAAMVTSGFLVTTTPTGGPDTGGPNSNAGITKKNTIAAGVFIPVMILLVIGLHWFISDKLVIIVEKITYPLRHWLYIMVGLDLLQFLLVIAALGVNDWAHDGNQRVVSGLWKGCFGSTCRSNLDYNGPLKGAIDAVRAFMIFAFFSALIALATTILWIVQESQRLLLSQIIFVSNVAIGFLTFMSMCLYAAYFNDSKMADAGMRYGAGFGIVVFVWLFSILTYLLSFAIWKKNVKGGPSAVTPKGSSPQEQQSTLGEEQQQQQTNEQQPTNEPTQEAEPIHDGHYEQPPVQQYEDTETQATEPATYETPQGEATQEV